MTQPKPALPSSVGARADAGRAVRQRVPRSSLASWQPAPDRDPVRILSEQEATRVPELVPVRHARMAVSPFTFFRGAAAVFAADLAGREHTDLTVQLCGDAHLTNFGVFASPERSLVFDLNDFDETHPGPFEWDLARLAASFEVAARVNGHEEAERTSVQDALGRAYCAALRELAAMGYLEVWYSRVSLEEVERWWGSAISPDVRKRLMRTVRKARSKDNLKAFDRLTTTVDGEIRFVSDPPLLERAEELLAGYDHDRLRDTIDRALASYRSTLPADRRFLLDRYRFVDLARKVVGVGSVGTRCWVVLLVGRDVGDPLFLQVKEAEASVLEAHLGPSAWSQHGQRVVEGQRLVQSSSDILLGWDRLTGVDDLVHDYYFRQLWDWKGSANVDDMPADLMVLYAEMCGRVLARAHARTGDAVALSAYCGGGGTLAKAMGRFASDYADQNERDHAAFVASLDQEPATAPA